MKRKEVESCTILLSLTGSRLYGIDNPESDYDYKGICIPPVQYFFGDSHFEQLDSFVDPDCLYPVLTNTDSQIYNLKKYIHLALLNNPNILELLWVAPEHYIVRTELADRLIALRELFLSTKVYHSYSGYAISQIKRVKTHRGWLQAYHANSDFFNTPPDPKDYGLEENPLRKEQLNAFLEFLYILIDDAAQYHGIRDEIFAHIDFKGALKQYKIKHELLDAVQYYTRSTDQFIHLLHSTQSYRQAKQEYDAFHSWRNNRNSKRAVIEERCGYDSKHLAHSYRLLTSGIEILNGQGVIPDRRLAGDADYIRSIRNGEIEYEEIIQQVDSLMVELETAKNKTQLPRTPDRQTIEKEVVSIIKEFLL